MLVDLGRNDLGRVCEYGTVKVETFMSVETYSHVIALSSPPWPAPLRQTSARWDALRATLSRRHALRRAEGASDADHRRARADQARRLRAAPSAGWPTPAISTRAIHIRTVVVKDGIAHVQAGGGTVADAKPAYEYEESGRQGPRRHERNSPRGRPARLAMRVLVIDKTTTRSPTTSSSTWASWGPRSRPSATTTPRSRTCSSAATSASVISPGPCTPNEAGISLEAARRFPEARIPTLGVCLGHQADGAGLRRHGCPPRNRCTARPRPSSTTAGHLPRELESPLVVGSLPSLVVDPELPDCLEQSAEGGGVVMGIRHRELPAEGVQFHPESGPHRARGKELLRNFLELPHPFSLDMTDSTTPRTWMSRMICVGSSSSDLPCTAGTGCALRPSPDLIPAPPRTRGHGTSHLMPIRSSRGRSTRSPPARPHRRRDGQRPRGDDERQRLRARDGRVPHRPAGEGGDGRGARRAGDHDARALATPVLTSRDDLLDTAGTGGGRPTFNVSTHRRVHRRGRPMRGRQAREPLRPPGSRAPPTCSRRSARASTSTPRPWRAASRRSASASCSRRPPPGHALRRPGAQGAPRCARSSTSSARSRTPPARPRQLIGVSDPAFLNTIAGAAPRDWGDQGAGSVLRRRTGRDEHVGAQRRSSRVDDGRIHRYAYAVSPSDVGLEACAPEAVTGGTPEENAAIARAILARRARPAPRQSRCSTRAAAIYARRPPCRDLAGGVAAAIEAAVDSGAAADALERFLDRTRELAPR